MPRQAPPPMSEDPRLHNQGPRANIPAQHDKDRQDAGLPLERGWKSDPTVRSLEEGPAIPANDKPPKSP